MKSELATMSNPQQRFETERQIATCIENINRFAGYLSKAARAAAELELQEMQTAEAIASDASAKFTIKMRIRELKEKLGP